MECPYPSNITTPSPLGEGVVRMHVGCGRCGACKHNKRVEWSYRIMQEQRVSKSCFFITLTYHDSYLPYSENWLPSLHKRDIELFNKKLRKEQSSRTEVKLRFFCVGEYGTKKQRPHYHVIFFNLLPELADPIQMLDIWKKGIVHQYTIDDGLIHYTTKYHVTANNRERKLDIEDDRKPEFTTQSRKPGLGFNYVLEKKDFHLKSKITIVRNNGYIQKMPGYYHRKIFGELPGEEKEKLRIEGERRAEEAHDKEIKRLIKKGFTFPEVELLKRQVYASKNVLIKAREKGHF